MYHIPYYSALYVVSVHVACNKRKTTLIYRVYENITPEKIIIPNLS